MTQDNIQTDTPQEQPAEYGSLEEAVFGKEGSNEVSSAFTSGNEGTTEAAPIEGQPALGNEGTPPSPTQPNNDETRYQYWQSQADKYKNELDEVKRQQAPQQQVQEPVQPTEPQREEFPPPPGKPQRPRAFSREEAYSDPSSESARFMDELEGWRDDMNEYNTLKSQYQTAVIEDKFNQMEQSRVDDIKRQQAAQQQATQEAEIKSHIMGHYSMNDHEASDFMSRMSDPNSITIDNLVQLYRLNNGNPQQQQQSIPQNPMPSQTFTQTKNAQQVPSPMGVMPSGQSNTDTKSFEDKIMDTMIGDLNSKNPWK
jgi:hypothetical protein